MAKDENFYTFCVNPMILETSHHGGVQRHCVCHSPGRPALVLLGTAKRSLGEWLNTGKLTVCDWLNVVDLMNAVFTLEGFCGLEVVSAVCAALRIQDSANSLLLSSVCCYFKTWRTLALSISMNLLWNVLLFQSKDVEKIYFFNLFLFQKASWNSRVSQSFTDRELR